MKVITEMVVTEMKGPMVTEMKVLIEKPVWIHLKGEEALQLAQELGDLPAVPDDMCGRLYSKLMQALGL